MHLLWIRRYGSAGSQGLTHLLEGSLSKKEAEVGKPHAPGGWAVYPVQMQAEKERESVDIKASTKQFLEKYSRRDFIHNRLWLLRELENGGGLVHISTLVDDYYVFDEQQMIAWANTQEVYRIEMREWYSQGKCGRDQKDFEL